MKALVDTSAWIDFLRQGDQKLVLLLQQQVCMHPMVPAELACGNLKNHQTPGPQPGG